MSNSMFHYICLTAAAVLLGGIEIAAGASTEQQCLAAAKDQLTSLRQEISAARKAVPKELKGRQVPSGVCTIRAIRLGVSMGLQRDFDSVVKAENLVNCLELEKFYVERNCTCLGKGKAFEKNEAEIDQGLEKYVSIKRIESRARSLGIKNPAIRVFVRDASELRDCMHGNALEQLRNVEKQLNAIVPVE